MQGEEGRQTAIKVPALWLSKAQDLDCLNSTGAEKTPKQSNLLLSQGSPHTAATSTSSALGDQSEQWEGWWTEEAGAEEGLVPVPPREKFVTIIFLEAGANTLKDPSS